MNNSILIFDIWGDFGHFKKPYTTTSPLSFAFPPRPTIAGMISAIIGLDKTEYADHFMKNEANIGLRIMKPVKKIRISQNLINTKKEVRFFKIKQRTQIRFEYIKDPKYRIYFHHSDKTLYKRVKAFLESHECVYTLSLGLSELLANFEFIGEFDLCEIENKGNILINSIIPLDLTDNFEMETGKAYFSENIPLEMNNKRIVTRFGSVFYERNGLPVRAMPETYFKAENDDTFLFL